MLIQLSELVGQLSHSYTLHCRLMTNSSRTHTLSHAWLISLADCLLTQQELKSWSRTVVRFKGKLFVCVVQTHERTIRKPERSVSVPECSVSLVAHLITGGIYCKSTQTRWKTSPFILKISISVLVRGLSSRITITPFLSREGKMNRLMSVKMMWNMWCVCN